MNKKQNIVNHKQRTLVQKHGSAGRVAPVLLINTNKICSKQPATGSKALHSSSVFSRLRVEHKPSQIARLLCGTFSKLQWRLIHRKQIKHSTPVVHSLLFVFCLFSIIHFDSFISRLTSIWGIIMFQILELHFP